MRPGQQNNNSNNNKNRSRGRNNNNNGGRKHLNPLSRNYESNGPDVKVRGNAAHIAEKYVQLARDAHSSGDSVMAENYLQHAEHYFRIVSAAQPQPQRTDQFGQDADSEDNDDDFAGDEQSRFDTPQYRASLQNDRQPQDERQQAQPQPRGGDQPQGERTPRADQPSPTRPEVAVAAEAGDGADGEANVEGAAPSEEEPRRVRERRPRRRRPAGGDAAAVDPSGPQPEVGDLPAFITAGGGSAAE